MRIITVINAKGGCGKSTLAANIATGLAARKLPTLLMDLDPQAQLTQWFGAGDGLTIEGSIASAFLGKTELHELIQATPFENLWFISSAIQLEDVGRALTDRHDYAQTLAQLLASPSMPGVEYIIVDSPNQISPIMENAIYVSDVFVSPFEGTQAVRSYANFYRLLLKLRGQEGYAVLHVLNRLSHQEGLRKEVANLLKMEGLEVAATEIRTCGWLARVSEYGGSIYRYRPLSNGAEDMTALVDEILATETAEVQS